MVRNDRSDRWIDQGLLRWEWWGALGAAGLIGLALLFMVFTWATPRWELFRDPPTGTYGARSTG
jgi:hypothetical protein